VDKILLQNLSTKSAHKKGRQTPKYVPHFSRKCPSGAVLNCTHQLCRHGMGARLPIYQVYTNKYQFLPFVNSCRFHSFGFCTIGIRLRIGIRLSCSSKGELFCGLYMMLHEHVLVDSLYVSGFVRGVLIRLNVTTIMREMHSY
jgi:hypothetical protein